MKFQVHESLIISPLPKPECGIERELRRMRRLAGQKKKKPETVAEGVKTVRRNYVFMKIGITFVFFLKAFELVF